MTEKIKGNDIFFEITQRILRESIEEVARNMIKSKSTFRIKNQIERTIRSLAREVILSDEELLGIFKNKIKDILEKIKTENINDEDEDDEDEDENCLAKPRRKERIR